MAVDVSGLEKNNMNNSLVSIIMPSYNSEDFIGGAIESVIRQTYPYWELIVVNDASTDNTSDVVKRYLNDSRIVLLENEKNSGVCFSRNRAIEYASGEFIACLDSDDEWLENKLEKQIDILKSGTTISFSAISIIDSKGDIVGAKSWARVEYTYQELLKYNFVAHSSLVFSKSILGEVRYSNVVAKGVIKKLLKKVGITRLIHEDYAFLLRLFRQSGIVAKYVDTPLVRYRVHGTNYSRGFLKKISSLYCIYKNEEGFSVLKSIFYTLRRVFFYLFYFKQKSS